MAEDAVVLEEPTQNGVVATEDTTHDLDDFVYTAYTSLFPDDCKDILEEMFKDKQYGWKVRARLVKRIQYHAEMVDALKADLSDMCLSPRQHPSRTRRTIAQIERETLTKFIEGLAEPLLQSLCVQKNVSYASFMNSGDKTGLVEALLDEMLAQDAA